MIIFFFNFLLHWWTNTVLSRRKSLFEPWLKGFPPVPLNFDDGIVVYPNLIKVGKLELEDFYVVGFMVFFKLPTFDHLILDINVFAFPDGIFTSFLHKDNPFSQDFQIGKHIHNEVLNSRKPLNWIVSDREKVEFGDWKHTLNSI